MKPVTFLYFAFGDNLNSHTLANFSMLSLKKFAPDNSRIVIYTDKPNYYTFLSPIVEARMMEPSLIKEWQGKYNFVWRIKIMALLDSAKKDPGHLMYVDADTFALKNLDSMIEKLEKNYCFMHLKESLLSEDKAKNKVLMWQQTHNKTFGGMLVDKNSAMWNAGIVAFSEQEKIMLLERALKSTDEMCEQKVEQWLIEQFSLSQSLAYTNKLLQCDEWFAHYWGFKEKVLRNIQHFLSTILQQGLSINDAVKLIDIQSWNNLLIADPKKTFLKKWFKVIS
ncbi:MAG: hypothetical protein K2Q18_08345 [Bdellovibrionales bacterium]|nr:hypothetical protein [Bdellovibrionales bacterium]